MFKKLIIYVIFFSMTQIIMSGPCCSTENDTVHVKRMPEKASLATYPTIRTNMPSGARQRFLCIKNQVDRNQQEVNKIKYDSLLQFEKLTKELDTWIGKDNKRITLFNETPENQDPIEFPKIVFSWAAHSSTFENFENNLNETNQNLKNYLQKTDRYEKFLKLIIERNTSEINEEDNGQTDIELWQKEFEDATTLFDMTKLFISFLPLKKLRELASIQMYPRLL